MKLQVPCYKCIEENKDDPLGIYSHLQNSIIDLDKWPYIEVKCEKGHLNRYTLNVELFELLFQQATYCVMDGYYREAVCTYNVALERFFEYAIELLILNSNEKIDFETIWKEVRNQSERQLGAYYFLWTAIFKESPIFLEQKRVEFRNSIVHKGMLASKEEAEGFGEYVFDYIKKSREKLEMFLGENLPRIKMQRLMRNCKTDLKKAWENPIKESVDRKELYQGIGSSCLPCFLNMDAVVSYKDCFKSENYHEYGLIK